MAIKYKQIVGYEIADIVERYLNDEPIRQIADDLGIKFMRAYHIILNFTGSPLGRSQHAKDLSGQKFNKLTLVSYVGTAESNGVGKYAAYLCKCDCGNEKIIRYDSMKAGLTKSCGCINSKRDRTRKK